MTNKERFISVLKRTNRPGIENVLSWLESTDFFTAPASTRYHQSYEGGLVEHSLEVYDIMMNKFKNKYDPASIAIVALLHDVCKADYYSTSYRNTKDENGKWITVPYYTVDDKHPFGHGEKSLIMLMGCGLEFNGIEEMMAIRWHMGRYVGDSQWNDLANAYIEYPMAMDLHYCDLCSTYNNK